MIFIRLLSTGAILVVLACVPSGPHKPVNEEGGQDAGEFSSAGYDSVKPLFAKYCAACHPSRSGPDWLDYSQAHAYANNGKLFRRVGRERSMPPPGTPQAASLSESERLEIANWAKAGGPRESVQGGRGGGSGSSAGEGSQERERTPQEKLVQNCLHCHGATGPDPSAQPRIPVLTGQSEKYIVEQLTRFKWRDRVDPTQQMNDIAIDLTPEQMQIAARYFAASASHVGTEPEKLSETDRALYQRGEKLAQRDCVSCHRNAEYGYRPTDALVPALAGQSRIYLINQLIYFRSDERSNPLMRQFALELRNEEIEALATYFANVR